MPCEQLPAEDGLALLNNIRATSRTIEVYGTRFPIIERVDRWRRGESPQVS